MNRKRMLFYCFSLFLLVTLFSYLPSEAEASTTTTIISTDAYTDEALAVPSSAYSESTRANYTDNFTTGSVKVNYVGGNVSNFGLNYQRAAIKCNISGITGTINSAKLKIVVMDAVNSPIVNLSYTSDDTWTQSNEKFPAYNSSNIINGYNNVAVTANHTMEFDVTNYIQSLVNASTTSANFVLTGTEGGDSFFNFVSNLQGVNQPELEITYTIGPVVAAVTTPVAGTYKAGQNLDFTVNYSETVNVTGTPIIPITLDTGGTVNASYISGSGSTALVFRYTVAAGDADTNGIVVGADINLSGGTIKNASNYDAALTLNSINSTTGVKVDTTPPTVTAGNISINGATGTGDSYKVGDTVTATWNNTAGGNNNNDISMVTVDFSQFGGGAAVAATNSAGTWTATYTIVAGAIDTTNRNISVTATDNGGNVTTMADDTNATLDSVAPTVTASRIEISGATGTDGAYKFGDTVTATWNNTEGGDNNSDTISGVTVDFSQFGGGAATAATNTSGTWTATYTIVAGAIDTTNRNVSVTATDNSGNATTMADDTNATLDSVAPIVTTAKISISGATGTGGSYKVGNTVTATWNNTAAGDNNSDISAVTVNFSQFGGGTVVATNSSGTWSATYTIVAGVIDSTNRNVILTATDDAGNSKVLAGNTNADLDNVAPTVTAGNISISGATGIGGVYKLGDTVTATWDNTAGGDNNSDTIVGVTVDFSQFGGGTAVAATNLGGIRTATYTIVAGTIEATNRKVSVKATDNAGNFTVTVDDTNATVDNQAPTVTTLSPADGANNIGVSSNLIITFNNDIAKVIGNINIFDLGDNLIEVIDVTSGKVTVSGNIVTINPACTLLFNTSYYVQIDNTAFNDTVGNSYSGINDNTSWNFTTTLSTNNELSSITLSNGNLDSTFESGKLIYNADVSNAVFSITVTPTVADSTATVTVNGVAVTNGNASGAISLSVGSNTITVLVTAASGATNTYTVTVTRAASSNANLSNLILSSGSLSPAFASGTSTYTASVSNAVSSITVIPTVADSTATVTVNGVAVTSGTASGAISLSVGSNTITVLVTAASGVTNNYTVIVTRAASSNADLSGLTLSSGSLSPEFASGTLTYTACVSNAISSITMTPTVADSTATVTVNGTTVTSGTSSGAISLSVGSNTITVLVTAASGATNTYTVTVTRAASSNANLSGLTLSSGTLNPVFSSGTQTYTASVSYGVNSITVTPTTADDTATVTVNGVAVTSGNPSGAISLSVGSNTMTVLVTAASGTTNTYTITVTRAVIEVPNIVSNPNNATVSVGNTATFTVVATVSDSGTLTYQWQKSTDNGSNWSNIGIGEATAISSSYTTGALATGDSGNQYRCVVTNTNNSTTATANSSAATVVVNALTDAAAPTIIAQPQGKVVSINDPVELSVAASNGVELSYQWYTSSTNSTASAIEITNATGAAIQVQTNTAGTTYYYCIVTNTDNSKTGANTATTTSMIIAVIVNANDVPNTYTLTYIPEANGTIAGTTIQTVTQGTSGLPVTAIPNSGYHFVKWSDNVTTATRTDSNVTDNITVSASFAVNETSSSPQTNTTPPKAVGINILVNGVTQTVATSETKKVDDKTITIVTIDDNKIEELLKNEDNNFTVTIPINNNSNMVIGQLNGQTIKNMETKEAVLEIKTENVTYTLPAAQINIDSVSSQMGEKVLLKDIVVSVSIANSSNNIARIGEDTANKNHYQIVVKPVDFEITCTSGGKSVDVSHFNGYVERTIAIPDGTDPSKITTGIVLNKDGTFSHVPTQIININGKYYAKINSLTNSTYSVLFNPIEFKDVEKHWAEDAISDMGSRLVVSGIGDGTFEPNRSITRGEFASILVKALGLMPETAKNSFSDVKSTDWYSGYVETAYKYGIISGYGNGKFGAKDEITREQAMNMVAKAMKITGLKVDFEAGEIESLLAGYIDSSNAASWASSSIASCVKAGIISGNIQKLLLPKDNITRAEVSVIVRKLLQKSNLI